MLRFDLLSNNRPAVTLLMQEAEGRQGDYLLIITFILTELDDL